VMTRRTGIVSSFRVARDRDSFVGLSPWRPGHAHAIVPQEGSRCQPYPCEQAITGQPVSTRHRCVGLRGREACWRRAWDCQATPMTVIVFVASSPWSGTAGVLPVR